MSFCYINGSVCVCVCARHISEIDIGSLVIWQLYTQNGEALWKNFNFNLVYKSSRWKWITTSEDMGDLRPVYRRKGLYFFGGRGRGLVPLICKIYNLFSVRKYGLDNHSFLFHMWTINSSRSKLCLWTWVIILGTLGTLFPLSKFALLSVLFTLTGTC